MSPVDVGCLCSTNIPFIFCTSRLTCVTLSIPNFSRYFQTSAWLDRKKISTAIHFNHVNHVPGISGNVTMILGVLVSSYLMTKYRPTARKVAALVFASKYIYAFGLLALMFCTCSFSNDLPGQLEPDGRFNLDRGCNQGCQCSTSEFVPICLRGPSGQSQTFFSPCHAGCTTYTSVNNSIEYQSCQ